MLRLYLCVPIFLAVAFAGLGCGTQDGDSVVKVSAADEDMNKAILEAQRTVEEFILAYQQQSPDHSSFTVKVPMKDRRDSVEHIWVGDITIRGDEFEGTLANNPEHIPDKKFGDVVRVKKNEISDWMYLENGVIVGGFTIRVLYDRATPEDREKIFPNVKFKPQPK